MNLNTQHAAVSAGAIPTPRQIEVDGRSILLDDAGFLADDGDWTPAAAEAMAAADGIRLTDDHWIVINFLHRYYRELGVAPELAILQRQLCKSEKDCRWNRKYIAQLFPQASAKQACRYAGLPKPVGRGCD